MKTHLFDMQLFIQISSNFFKKERNNILLNNINNRNNSN